MESGSIEDEYLRWGFSLREPNESESFFAEYSRDKFDFDILARKLPNGYVLQVMVTRCNEFIQFYQKFFNTDHETRNGAEGFIKEFLHDSKRITTGINRV